MNIRIVRAMSSVRTMLRSTVEKLSPFNKVLMLGRANCDPMVLPSVGGGEKRTAAIRPQQCAQGHTRLGSR